MSTSPRQRVLTALSTLLFSSTLGCKKTDLKITASRTPASILNEGKLETSDSSTTSISDNTCEPTEKLEGVSTPRTPAEIRMKIEAIENYLEDHPYSVPSFTFTEKADTEYQYSHEEKLMLLVNYCREYKETIEWDLGEGIEKIQIRNTFLDDEPMGLKVTFPGVKDAQGSIFRMKCDLESPANGKNVLGLFRRHLSTILLKNDEDTNESVLQNIGMHEGVHLLNAQRWEYNSKAVSETYRAEQLFTPREIELLGMKRCSPVSYSILSEMSADGIQIYMSEIEQAKLEWLYAQDNRTSNYRGRYSLLDNIFFEELNDEHDLSLKIREGFDENYIFDSDVRVTGKFLFTLGEKGMERLKVLSESGDSDILKR